MKSAIGIRIRELREQKGMTRKQLAASLGVSESTIKNFEYGVYSPNRARQRDLADALDVPFSALTEAARASGGPANKAPQRARKPTQSAPELEQPKETLCEIVNRMCTGRTCEECILGCGRAENERLCVLLGKGVDIEALVLALRQWAAVNPPTPTRSYMDDFFEKFPDAPRREDGAPLFAVNHIYKTVSKDRQAEFQKLTHGQRWAKPMRYWEEAQ